MMKTEKKICMKNAQNFDYPKNILNTIYNGIMCGEVTKIKVRVVQKKFFNK
jgi:hypothetical protein